MSVILGCRVSRGKMMRCRKERGGRVLAVRGSCNDIPSPNWHPVMVTHSEECPGIPKNVKTDAKILSRLLVERMERC